MISKKGRTGKYASIMPKAPLSLACRENENSRASGTSIASTKSMMLRFCVRDRDLIILSTSRPHKNI